MRNFFVEAEADETPIYDRPTPDAEGGGAWACPDASS
jgi:hypothetical protein